MAAKVVPNPLASDRAEAFALTPVSRETEARLERFVDLRPPGKKPPPPVPPRLDPKALAPPRRGFASAARPCPRCTPLGRSRIGRRISGFGSCLCIGREARSLDPPGRKQQPEGCFP